ncbi:MAG: UDP-N-acetylmuramoyl-tripeptide--D-alanyl-D-alanine ligase [Chloroflexota bacterium]|nr:UDP-N-acetylmuramoyl-tripeptide--D-alanyl-D-alanine ligase [Chloroflexota bacterium]
MLTLGNVIEALQGIHPDHSDRVITSAVVDSRLAIPGALFVALPGERVDGHNFVDDAFKHGARFALVQQLADNHSAVLDLRTPIDRTELSNQIAEIEPHTPIKLYVEDSLEALQQIARFWRRKIDLRVIGITGSVGKSTTKEVVAEVLNQRYRTLKNPGNLNNEIGLPLTILGLGKGHERAVLEMGFYVPGEIQFLCDIALPHVGVMTLIGTVHAERAGSQEAIARGKAELFEALPPAPEGVAILNNDDPLVREMRDKTQARVFFYGLTPQSDLWADSIESLGLDGINFRLHYHGDTLHMRVPLIGRHSVHTVLRAAAVGLIEGLTWQEIVNGLRSENIQLRLVVVKSHCGALLLDDTYNASPESTLAALNLLDELDGNKVAVLGDMLELGPYERQGHELVGRRAAEVAHELVTVGELGLLISAAARQAGMQEELITELENSQEAIEFLEPRLCEDDVVLIKGSHGMRMDHIVTALETHR